MFTPLVFWPELGGQKNNNTHAVVKPNSSPQTSRRLEAALLRALDGNGGVVGIVGEPGVGKSRLCQEFVERCQSRGISVYGDHGVSHGKAIPHLPMLELFRGFFRVGERDDAEVAREKIVSRMVLLETLRDTLPLAFELLGVTDPEHPAPP